METSSRRLGELQVPTPPSCSCRHLSAAEGAGSPWSLSGHRICPRGAGSTPGSANPSLPAPRISPGFSPQLQQPARPPSSPPVLCMPGHAASHRY